MRSASAGGTAKVRSAAYMAGGESNGHCVSTEGVNKYVRSPWLQYTTHNGQRQRGQELVCVSIRWMSYVDVYKATHSL